MLYFTIRYYLMIILLSLSPLLSLAQVQPAAAKTNYNSSEAFGPLFYTQNGNSFRSANGSPGDQYWQNKADYHITARLVPDQKMVTGTVTITYQNNSPDQLSYLWLNLDQNKFTDTSRGYEVTPKKSRYGAQGEQFDGGYKLSNLKVSRKSAPLQFSSVIDDTRMHVRLEQPLSAKGDIVTISMDYTYIVPQDGSDRTGYVGTKNGDIFAIAQWYPRMCVYDDIIGWNTLPYWGGGEFYCEYGDINYEITAPADHIVMGSGELLNPEKVFTPAQLKRWNAAKASDQTIHIRSAEEVTDPQSRPAGTELTWKFKIRNSRDAAWAASKSFILDAAGINLPSGKHAMAVSAHPVESNGKDSYGRGVEYVKTTIEHYSKLWMEYPYPMAVNVAANVGGMEYPGIVFCDMTAKKDEAWGVIDHEFGHTCFPMIVGSNERKYGWMDEGFNTFINGISQEEFNNGEYGLKKPADMNRIGRYIVGNPEKENIMLMPDGMKEENIGNNLYSKPAWGLNLLRNQILGHDRFDYAFKQYIKNWAFKHPTPFDFFRSIENGAGEDLAWFWRGWFLNNWKSDLGIGDLKPINGKGNSAGYTIQINNLEKLPMPVIIQVTTKGGRKEIVKVPVDVWMKNTSWVINYATTEEITEVIIDPEKVLPDANPDNNIWQAAGARQTPVAPINLDAFLGTYSNTAAPIKIIIAKGTEGLTAKMGAKPAFVLKSIGGNKYVFEEHDLEFIFNTDKNEMIFAPPGQEFIFTKDK
jgi:hypothetical protein